MITVKRSANKNKGCFYGMFSCQGMCMLIMCDQQVGWSLENLGADDEIELQGE